MPSPDISQYYDLRIYDKDVQDVFEAAKDNLQAALPDWVPREGNTEVLLLEAMAWEVAETVFAINRLPSAIMEALLKLYRIERDSGAAPVAMLEFTAINNIGYTIAAGVQVRMPLPGGLLPVTFVTTTDLTILPGQTTGLVEAVGDRFTDEANGVAPGTVLELMDSIIYIETVTLDSFTTTGRLPEGDTEYFTRAIARFDRLTETLVLPKHFVSFALENPTFYRAKAIDNWNGSTGVPGDHPGFVTVAVYGNGAMATTQQKNDLKAQMEALALANLTVNVIDPTITAVPVTATVRAKASYSISDVQTRVVQTLNDYLDPMKWEWSGTVRRFELISLIDAVDGVDYVESLVAPAADVILAGNAPLADAGALTITVNAAA